LYETTREFLVAFGLRDLGDLPKADGELMVVDPTAAPVVAAADPEDSAVPSESVAADLEDSVAPPESVADAEDSAARPESGAAPREDPAASPAPVAVADPEDAAPAADPPQQDPGPGGTDVAPRG